MTIICRLQKILQVLALILTPFCAVKACNINIYSNSSIGFTLQPYVNESNIDFDSDTIQLVLSPCDHDLKTSELMIIICGKNFTMQNIEKSEIISNNNEGFWECRNATSLKLNIIGCQSVRAKLIENVTIENCTFASLHAAGCQTVLNFSSTNATIKNCSFTSMNNDTAHSDPMIVASNTTLSLINSMFIVQSGKMIHVKQGSEMNIMNTTFCDSKVTQHGDHPALIKALDSKVNLKNSTIRNNTGGLIVSAKNCAQVSIVNCHFLNNHAWECTFCASQSNVSIENSSISENFGNFSVIYLVKTKSNVADGVKYSNNNGSFLVRRSYITFDGMVLFENCRQMFDNSSQAEKYRTKGTLTIIQSTAKFLGNSSFLDNHSSKSGGALYITDTWMYIYGNLTVTGNRADKNGGGALFYGSLVFCSAECIFTNNIASCAGGAISAVDTLITLRNDNYWPQSSSFGLLNISDNAAHIGGGIYLEINSKIYGFESNHFHYKIMFARNTASLTGGAIHVNDSTYSSVCASKSYVDYDIHTECFLQILHDDEDFGSQSSSITFTNNFAKDSGSILYGGLLDRCTVSPLATIYNSHTFHSDKHVDPYTALAYFENVTSLNLTANNFDGIASDSLRVCFCQGNKTNCTHELHDKYVKRGEEFTIAVTVVDQVNRSASNKTPISIYLEPESGPSILGKGQ